MLKILADLRLKDPVPEPEKATDEMCIRDRGITVFNKQKPESLWVQGDT